jgi:hypothetical protein
LASKEISVRDVFTGEEIALSVVSAYQCRRDARGDVIDVDDRKATARMSRYAMLRDFEHCVPERMRQRTRTVDDARVYDDDANAVAARVRGLLFGKSLALVIDKF